MTPLTTAAIVFGILNGLLFIHSLVRWFRPYRDTPCPGERDQQGASNVDAELDRSKLPAGMVCNFHTTEVPRG